jgi:hypothetical protein
MGMSDLCGSNQIRDDKKSNSYQLGSRDINFFDTTTALLIP